MSSIDAYPLQWPAGWNRSEVRQRARFGTKRARGPFAGVQRLSVSDGTNRVLDALQKMGVGDWSVIISSNLELRRDGLPRSSQKEPSDPGVCVYWRDRNDERRCIAIDQYDRAADNLGAIAATLEAMRAIERHGSAEILDRAFTGFVALPDLSSVPWYHTLGYSDESQALASDFEARARSLKQKLHPDKPTGDEWQFKQVVKALEAGRTAASA